MNFLLYQNHFSLFPYPCHIFVQVCCAAVCHVGSCLVLARKLTSVEQFNQFPRHCVDLCVISLALFCPQKIEHSTRIPCCRSFWLATAVTLAVWKRGSSCCTVDSPLHGSFCLTLTCCKLYSIYISKWTTARKMSHFNGNYKLNELLTESTAFGSALNCNSLSQHSRRPRSAAKWRGVFLLWNRHKAQ